MTGRARQPLGVVDIVASAVLWVVHAGLAVVVWLVAILSAFGTDACAYEDCGDPRWIDRAMTTAAVGGCILLIGSLSAIILRARSRRLTWPFSLLGCLLQLLLLPVVFEMAHNAEPIS